VNLRAGQYGLPFGGLVNASVTVIVCVPEVDKPARVPPSAVISRSPTRVVEPLVVSVDGVRKMTPTQSVVASGTRVRSRNRPAGCRIYPVRQFVGRPIGNVSFHHADQNVGG
jgi:hypothetical protein